MWCADTGHGITQTAAQKGFDVVAVETHAPAMEKGMSMIKGSLGTIAGKMEKKGELQGVRCWRRGHAHKSPT